MQENKEEDGLEVLLRGRPARAHLDRSEGQSLLRSDTRGSDTSMDSLPPRRACLKEGSTSLAYSDSSLSSGKAPPLVVSNGSKLHMRFFSEPPAASFSELSDEESDMEGLYSNEGSIVSKDDSHADEESLSRSGMRSVQHASHSPRSAWRAEDRVLPEEDDDLCDLPEAESTCKKVKVMGGRNAELEEDSQEAPSGPVAAPPTSPVPPKLQSTPAPAAPPSSTPVVPPRSATSTPPPPLRVPPIDVGKNVGSGPPSPLPAKPPVVVTRQHSSESNQSASTPPANESGHGRGPGSMTTVASYDISVRSVSESSDSSCASGPSSPIKSQTSTPPASPIAGGAARVAPVGFTQEAMDVLQCISRQQQRQEQRQHEHQQQGGPSASSAAGGSSGSRSNVMTLVIRTPLLGKLNLVEFEFNLSTDDPEEVAREMVTELGIPETDMKDMAAHIAMLKEKELARRAAKAEARSAPSTAEPPAVPAPAQPQAAPAAPAVQALPVPKPIATPAPTVKIPDKKEAPSPARPGALPGRVERKEGGTSSSACPSPTVVDSSTAGGAASSKPSASSLTRRPSSSSLASSASGAPAHARCVSSGSHMQRLPSEKHLLAHHHHQHSLPTVPSSASLASAQAAVPLVPPGPVSRSSSNESLLGSSKNSACNRGLVSVASASSLFGSNPRSHDTDEELENLSLAEVETGTTHTY